MLVTPREAMGDDQQGVWYHLFGTAAIQFQDEVNVVPWALTRWTMEEGMPLADKIPSLNLKALIPPHISEMKEWESKSEIGTMLSNYALALENLVRSSEEALLIQINNASIMLVSLSEKRCASTSAGNHWTPALASLAKS